MLLLSGLLGEKGPGRDTQDPYESGIPPSGSPQARHAVHFYLVAVFFLVFDLEAVFLFSWAVAARNLGWGGYISAVVFVGVLLAALVYLWRDGALDWASSQRARQAGAGLLAAEAMGGERAGGALRGSVKENG
jgi:NADH-quinone oxidoreductase subunit A